MINRSRPTARPGRFSRPPALPLVSGPPLPSQGTSSFPTFLALCSACRPSRPFLHSFLHRGHVDYAHATRRASPDFLRARINAYRGMNAWNLHSWPTTITLHSTSTWICSRQPLQTCCSHMRLQRTCRSLARFPRIQCHHNG